MPKFDLRKLIAPANRGILLDLVVFVVNLVLMVALTGVFRGIRDRSHNDRTAQIVMLLFCLGLAFLQPIAGLLKRRRAHERNASLERPEPRILLNPFFYFLSKLVFLIAAGGLVVDIFYGGGSEFYGGGSEADYFGLPPKVFFLLFLGVPLTAAANTALVFFYFWKPGPKVWFGFLEWPGTETVADAMLFLNMIGYQAFWGLLVADLTTDFRSLLGRFSMFIFAAALIYLPPRLFYLGEDGDHGSTWLWMLLANSPVLVRMLVSW